MKLFAEQIGDMFFLPLAILATLFKPFNFMWLSLIINSRYDLERSMIMNYFFKCCSDILLWLPLGVGLSLIMATYCAKHIFTLAKGYYIIYMNRTLQQSITDQSNLRKYSKALLNKIIGDLPHIPLYFIMSLSFFHLLDQQLSPQKGYTLFQKVTKMFYIHRVKSSPRSN